MHQRNRQIAFAKRPEGIPDASAFVQREAAMPTIGDGELLCRTLVLSIDPYLRLKMHDRRSYTPPLRIGELISGRGVAEVVESRDPGYRVGDIVVISGGWQDFAAIKSSNAKRIEPGTSLGAWLGPLGTTGATAYVGLLEIGKPRAGETLVVSGAAGAVGSLVGQIGKIFGCRVVGIAGSEEKCRTVLEEFGFDACVSYRDRDFGEQLRQVCKDGCGVYFDNVGGSVSFEVAKHFNDFARIVVCGLISQYSGQQPTHPTALDEYLRLILMRRLTVRGFIVSDIAADYPAFESDMRRWLEEGRIRFKEHAYRGFDNIVPAFLGMLAGENTGKTLVYVAEQVAAHSRNPPA
jgi:hypothetical protein